MAGDLLGRFTTKIDVQAQVQAKPKVPEWTPEERKILSDAWHEILRRRGSRAKGKPVLEADVVAEGEEHSE